MDKLKYSTLPRRKKSKHKERKGSTDDTEVKPSKADTISRDKKISLVSKPWKKSSPRPSREIPVEDFPKKMGLDKDVEKLQSFEKSILAALRWFVDVVHKNILVMLPGSTTKVLQEVMDLTNHLNTCATGDESSSVMMSAHSEVRNSLANLIRWADNVVLHGTPEGGQEEAKNVSEAVRLSIKSLVTAYMDRLKDKEQKLQVTQTDSKPKRTSLPAQPMEPPPSPQEPEMLPSTHVSSVDYNSNSREDPASLMVSSVQSESGIPSGHPSPERQFLSSSPDLDETQDLAPPIPPKNGRASMFEFPTNTDPVMNQSDFLDRSFGGSSMSVMSRTSQQSQQSNFSSISSQSSTSGISMKSCTSSSYHASDFSSHMSVESNFTRMSVQSMEVLKSHSGSMEIAQYSMVERPKSAVELKNSVTIPAVEITDPPALPKKERRYYRQRKLSDYDNVDPSEANSLKERCAKLQDEETLHWEMGDSETYQVSDEDERRNSSGYGSVCTQSAEEAPPLPPKVKHIDTYLDLLGGYNENNFQMEYYNEHRQVEYVETSDKYSLTNRENFFHESYNYSSRFPKSPRNSYGSSVETSSEGSYEGSLEGMPPVLPAKQNHTINMSPEHLPMRGRFNTCPDLPPKPLLALKKKSESISENGTQCRPEEEPAPENTLKPSNEKSEKGETCLLDLISVSDYLIKNTEEGEPPVKGGPIDALIVFAADVDRKELVLSEVFLSTYRTVISARELLDKLLYRYRKFRNKSDIKAKQANRNAFFLLLRIAGELIGQVEDDILELLMDLVFQLLTDGELMLAKLLRDRILSKIEDNKKAELMSHKAPISTLGVSVSRATLLDFRSHELAEQMTLMDSELFSKIEVPEVLLWAREQSETLSPNLTIFTEHFNKMSFWVRSLILQETKPADREKLLIKFIKIMKNLKKLSNFNSYLAVLSALDSAPVRRLDWQKQTVEWLKEYSSLIDSSSSFKCYRDTLAAAEPPCIPYLGLILQDMTFVHIGNPDKLPDSGNVNFIKCWQFFNIMDSMRRFKQTQYDNLKKDEKILAFFNNFTDTIDEEAMWQLSKEIKPQGRGKTSKVN